MNPLKNLLPITFSLLLLSLGCAGPVPAQTRLSLLTWYAPQITIVMDPCATNAAGAASFARDSDSMSVRPSMRGVCLFVDNQIALPNGGGTAASNSVLSGIEIPLVK